MMSRSLFSLLLLLLSLSLSLPFLITASEGDRDPAYQYCVTRCQGECQHSDKTLNWDLKIMGWTCQEDCRYTCMRQHSDSRVAKGEPIVKYYGKWPFIRYWGFQEIASSLFSIANAIPHAYYAIYYRRLVPPSYAYRNLWTSYSLVSINTWWWSTIFHARDTLLTERLDYFCASFGIVYSLAITLIRIFHIRTLHQRASIMIPLCGLFFIHIGYLQFVHFDYGWNMTVSLCTGITYSLVWLIWAARTRRPYVHKLLGAIIGLWLAALLEVGDFPPIWGIFDAHAIWHGITPALSCLFYSFLIDDANWYQRNYLTKRQ